MKTASKLLTGIMVFVTLLSIPGVNILAQGEDFTATSTFREIIQEKSSQYVNDPEFYREMESLGVSFDQLIYQKALTTYQSRMKMIDYQKLSNEFSTQSVGNNGQYLYANVKLIQQTNSDNCGPTSALQVLYGMGCQNLVSGTTDAEKISQLESESGTDGSGTMVYRLTNCLNRYTTNFDYQYQIGKTMTIAQFQSKVETSLYYDTAPILHARTEYLWYYGGHPSGHYIAVSALDRTDNTIQLQDCNYHDEYFGTYEVEISEAYDSISKYTENDRYLIYMSY
jgi:hypothetical protein